MSLVFLGGYTQDIPMASGEIVPGRSSGIACCRLDDGMGRLDLLRVTPAAPNPSYLTLAPSGTHLYCANELETVDGIPGSLVSACSIEGDRVCLLDRRFAAGPLACYVTMSPDGRHLLAASYNGGICVLPVGEDHALRDASCSWRFQGRGMNPDRQEMPHPHQILIHPDGERVYASDLGTDRLRCFRADWDRGWLTPEEAGDIPARPGQGIRHGVFDAGGQHLYMLTELSGEIDVFHMETRALVQVRSVLPRDLNGSGMAAALRLHPCGRFLYASLRGPSLIAVLPVWENGEVGAPAFYPSGGQTPRDFCLTADGRFLLAGGQDDCSVCVHAIDPATGGLQQVWRMENAGSVTTIAVRPE